CMGLLDAPAPRFAQRGEYEDARLILGRRQHDGSGARWWHHMPAPLVRERLSPSWPRYQKACSDRHPFDTVLSAFRLKTPQPLQAELAGLDFTAVRRAFHDWALGGGDLMPDRDACVIDGVFCLDQVIRYETLQDDLAALCEQV